VSAHWDGTSETEDAIKEKAKATIRCIPLNNEQEVGTCILNRKAKYTKGFICKSILIFTIDIATEIFRFNDVNISIKISVAFLLKK
jgi:hypothetical protein